MIQCEIIGDIVLMDPVAAPGRIGFEVECAERRPAPKGSAEKFRYCPVLFHVTFPQRVSVSRHLHTGARVFVRGRLVASVATGTDGEPAVWLGIRATEVRMCVEYRGAGNRRTPGTVTSIPSVRGADETPSHTHGTVTVSPGPVVTADELERTDTGGTAGLPRKECARPDPDSPADRTAIERLRRFFGGR